MIYSYYFDVYGYKYEYVNIFFNFLFFYRVKAAEIIGMSVSLCKTCVHKAIIWQMILLI